jgi:hypothetical protein
VVRPKKGGYLFAALKPFLIRGLTGLAYVDVDECRSDYPARTGRYTHARGWPSLFYVHTQTEVHPGVPRPTQVDLPRSNALFPFGGAHNSQKKPFFLENLPGCSSSSI